MSLKFGQFLTFRPLCPRLYALGSHFALPLSLSFSWHHLWMTLHWNWVKITKMYWLSNTGNIRIPIEYNNQTSLVFKWWICVWLSNGLVFEWWSENWAEQSLFMVQNVRYSNCQPMWLYHLNTGHPYCPVFRDESGIQVFSIQMFTVLDCMKNKMFFKALVGLQNTSETLF